MILCQLILKKITDEIKDLKKQVNFLYNEVQTLKENYESLGYNSDDNVLSTEEKKELDKIRSDIKKGDFQDLTELN